VGRRKPKWVCNKQRKEGENRMSNVNLKHYCAGEGLLLAFGQPKLRGINTSRMRAKKPTPLFTSLTLMRRSKQSFPVTRHV